MVSELKIKISDILGKYLKNTPMNENKAIALVDELAELISTNFRPGIMCPMCEKEGHYGDECPNL
jgi:hypothetical protein